MNDSEGESFLKVSQEKKKILRARAISLAKRPVMQTDENLEILEFRLSHEKYGIESRFIREVYPLKELTSVPCTPSFVAGIINVRGQIVSVIDIKIFFDLPENGLTNKSRAIIIRNEKMEFGILADEILDVRSIPGREIHTSFPTLTGIRAEYLKGVTKEHLVVLDAGKILSDEKIIVQEEV